MNFLLRSSQTAAASDQPSISESSSDAPKESKLGMTLEGLIAEDPYSQIALADDDRQPDEVGAENGSGAAASGPDPKMDASSVSKYTDVTEEEGWITVPYKELPDNWKDAPNISSFRTLDRPFIFPGEQVHILACLSASKHDTEIITPFKVAALMSKNGKNQDAVIDPDANTYTSVDMTPDGEGKSTGEIILKEENPHKHMSSGESLLRIEDHKRQAETLLQRFRNSHFFVRIAESDEPLWSKRSTPRTNRETSEIGMTNESRRPQKEESTNAIVDRGNFNANVSGGLARTVECCSLSNGDIVVLLQVNVGVDCLRDPVIEILQFEKFQSRHCYSENQDNMVYADRDPCGELLKWLLPLDNAMPPPARPLSPPILGSGSGISNASHRSNFSASGTQLFSHFRSYSMSSLPQNAAPKPPPITAANSNPNFDLENWDQFSSKKIFKSRRTATEELLSFRGVSLEPERFSVRCGLEGIFVPGRRWRRKLEVIQPVEIKSFSANCNTNDLLCVQIKNVSPAHSPDVVVFIDAITIVFEEAAKGGQPASLPVACIEAGNENSLPNLPLRRGEEHSFILKPAASVWKNLKACGEKSPQVSRLPSGNAASTLRLPPKIIEAKSTPTTDHYAVLISCRCNYTESRLFFKKATSWRPRVPRDLMISVASEMSRKSLELAGGISQPQLPVQVLTLQASNLTSQDITLTVLAPASFTSPPSVVSLNSSPTTPMSPFIGFSELTGKLSKEKRGTPIQGMSSAPSLPEKQSQDGDSGIRSASLGDPHVPVSGVSPSPDLTCTHLWLQSRVPLGCVPSQSMATIKLELLPLTDGIITLDTLQIDVKEKGLTYIPEHSLKINATSSISTGII